MLSIHCHRSRRKQVDDRPRRDIAVPPPRSDQRVGIPPTIDWQISEGGWTEHRHPTPISLHRSRLETDIEPLIDATGFPHAISRPRDRSHSRIHGSCATLAGS
jgi:hypothetical protein